MVPILGSLKELRVLWGKFQEGPDKAFHPLICHLLDSAAVARIMWEEIIPGAEKAQIANLLQKDETTAGKWMSFWAGLHDVGKVTPAFQCQLEHARARLKAIGLGCANQGEKQHGTASVVILRDNLGKKYYQLSTVLGGHHGIFPRNERVSRLRDGLSNVVGYGKWKSVAQDLVKEYARLLDVTLEECPDISHLPPEFLLELAGLVSVADWIASAKDFFPYAGEDVDLQTYLNSLDEKVKQALDAIGWSGWTPGTELKDFKDLFPFISTLRPLQRAAIQLRNEFPESGMLIIEAPTGEGKTEAAMYLADCWAVILHQRGCYFALPTQATSNQMFGRILKFLLARYASQTVNLNLLHGHSSLSAEFKVLRQQAEHRFSLADIEGEKGYDGAPASVIASEWFSFRKRGLLSPFGVGTIDQALLAVLQTRHFFVRLFGLGGKIVIIDEVHAYDAYMTTLLELLLEWLAALGSSVILLSATLPRGRRAQLLKAYAKGRGGSSSAASDLPSLVAQYPRMSWVVGGKYQSLHFEADPTRRKEIRILWKDGAIPTKKDRKAHFSLARDLEKVLVDGGCVVIICNTVDRVQRMYLALNDYFEHEPDLVHLFHARFTFSDREEREQQVLASFGKPNCGENAFHRPARSILIATQVIEQSLDLDFDLLVTDLAPIDLVLQRAGRLHRHERERPEPFRHPQLWICTPSMAGEIPQFGPRNVDTFIYDAHILLRSWLSLRQLNQIVIPDEIEPFIEKVYGLETCPADLPSALQEHWRKSYENLQKDLREQKSLAKKNGINTPDFKDNLLQSFNMELEEENPEIHPALQALTRLSGPTLSVVCLFEGEDPATMKPEDLLKRSLQISHRALVTELMGTKPLAGWKNMPLLRHHRPLYFGTNGTALFKNYGVSYDSKIGLKIYRLTNITQEF